ncbi:MAG: PTS sugar transporter subunit IIA [Planctomycetaceae bacterium]|jgi:PTS system nitrogen regulatory IIA component|nr:PTS sugar transporter subunit IIA [Planctomycetaceae bacterium]
MPHSVLSFPQLVKYLHLPESKVKKLVDRGDIPGRKVKGEWQFSMPEINTWLEQRIGVSDDSELAVIEENFERASPPDEQPTASIVTFLPLEAVAVPLAVRTKESAIRSMTQLAVNTGLLWDGEKMADALRKREELHPTALDNGVAILHPRRPMPNLLSETFLALGVARAGIPFGGGFGNLTDVFFLLCSMDDQIHLRLLARLSRVLTAPNFLATLRQLESAQEIKQLIADTEAAIE